MTPHLLVAYCHSGQSRVVCNMREYTFARNDLAIVMPGYVIRQLDCSEDFTFTRLVVSEQMFADLRTTAFSHDYEKFSLSPIFSLTDEQAERLLSIFDLIDAIASLDTQDLPHRRQLMLMQMSVGYELLNYYRREQDRGLGLGPHAELFTRFCKLVIEHYRESREAQYYADLLHFSPRHFSKIIKEETGGQSPAEWIEQYVVASAKHLIETNSNRTLKEIAYMLGFNEPTSFYRYFKRVSGITAKEYRESLKSHA